MATEECNHCGAAFDDEETYLRHLQDEHGDDLGRIEQRRVASLEADDEGPDAVMYGAAIGALALGSLLAYVLFFSGGGSTGTGPGDGTGAAITPHDVGSVHYHGSINVTIGGQQIDFGQPKFQYQNTGADAFHFERGNGERWHGHARDVTLGYAMSTLGIDVTNDTVTYQGTTYGDDPGETVRVLVNGEPVDPSSYVLQEGDRIRIVASNSSSG